MGWVANGGPSVGFPCVGLTAQKWYSELRLAALPPAVNVISARFITVAQARIPKHDGGHQNFTPSLDNMSAMQQYVWALYTT